MERLYSDRSIRRNIEKNTQDLIAKLLDHSNSCNTSEINDTFAENIPENDYDMEESSFENSSCDNIPDHEPVFMENGDDSTNTHASVVFEDSFNFDDIKNDSTDGLSDNDSSCEKDLSDLLMEWFLVSGIAACHMNSLLLILRNYFPSLPKDARTLVKTPISYPIQSVAGGNYYHFGLERGLTRFLKNGFHSISNQILSLQINIDGLPLFKSSSIQFWPILCIIREDIHLKPFLIGIFQGHTKPSSVVEYLQTFIDEAKRLLGNGLKFGNLVFKVCFHSFVCDAPARSFLKGTKGHTGYNGCERCVQRGVWFNRMTFPEVSSQLRTDDDFEIRGDPNHQIGDSPLSVLSFKCVSGFPLDYMHLVCLGVVRRLLNLWIKGPLKTRIGRREIENISDALCSYKVHMPREILRKGRELTYIDRWKATEFRTFLLYTGPVALCKVLSEECYYNFIMLHVAISIFCNRFLCQKYFSFGKELLVKFVKHFATVYGKDFLVYNVHSLIHLSDDVQNFGTLNTISCFPFENYLKSLKRLIRKPDKPLQQVIRRLTEKEFVKDTSTINNKQSNLKKPHNMGPLKTENAHSSQYKQYFFDNFMISTEDSDNTINWNGCYYIVKNIVKCNDSIDLLCNKLLDGSNFFTYPLDSSLLNILFFKRQGEVLHTVPISDNIIKMIRLPFNDGHVVLPLNHTLHID